jgi:hypothetical protein
LSHGSSTRTTKTTILIIIIIIIIIMDHTSITSPNEGFHCMFVEKEH